MGGVRTLVGIADGASPAAAMYDDASGLMFGPLVGGHEAPDVIDGFQDWLRREPYVRLAAEIGLTHDELPGIGRDGTDARHWPEAALAKLVGYYRREVFEGAAVDG